MGAVRLHHPGPQSQSDDCACRSPDLQLVELVLSGGRLEAITSRPLLLAAVGKAASHAGQTTLYLTSIHARTDTINQLLINIRAALQHVRQIAEQFKDVDRWGTLLRYVCQKIAPRTDARPACQMLPATG